MDTSTSPKFAGGTLLVIALTLAMSLVMITTNKGETPWGSERASSETIPNMKIKMVISGKTLTATLPDNPTARDFASLLPLKLSMDDLFGREKFAHLPKALSEKGPRTRSYQVGDIAYWSPAHDVAIYYQQDGESIPSPGIISIGKIDAGTEAFNVPGSLKVTIEIAK
jgi:hypothetical protein